MFRGSESETDDDDVLYISKTLEKCAANVEKEHQETKLKALTITNNKYALCENSPENDSLFEIQDTSEEGSFLNEDSTSDSVEDDVLGSRRGRRKRQLPSDQSLIQDDVDFVTSNRRTSQRVVGTNSNAVIPKRTRRGRGRGRGTNANPQYYGEVISIGCSDDEGYNAALVTGGSRGRGRGSNTVQNKCPDESISLDSDDDANDIVFWNNETRNIVADTKDVLNIKISWMCDGGKIYKLGNYEPFSKIYTMLAEETGYSIDRIVLSKGKDEGKRIKPNDTPKSINLDVVDILVGSITSEALDDDSADTDGEENVGEDAIKVKFLVENQKAPIFLNIKKREPMSVVQLKLAGQLKCSADKIRLWFDGESIEEDETPDSLDLEGDECLEVRFRKR